MNSIKFFLKRPQVWGGIVSVAVMALIALLFFYPDNFEGNSLQQPDMAQGAANGHEGVVWQEQTGEKALWTNSLFGGMPTFQISPSYPSDSLMRWVNTVYGLWLPSPSNLLFMMMAGFFILMYCLRKRWYYALIGAVAWGFSSYFIIIIGAGHIWKFMALTYIPPTIGGLVLLYNRRYILGTGITAFFAMMQLGANHPQMSYYFGLVMLIMAICYLIEALRTKTVRRWLAGSGLALAAAVLAFGANAPSLYHTYKYAKETKRAQSELAVATTADDPSVDKPTGGLPKEQILGWSYGRAELFSLVIPNIKGGAGAKPVNGEMVMLSLADLDEAASVADDTSGYILHYLPQYFNDSESTNGPVYVGVIIAALFLVGCFIVRGPLKWAMVACAIISCILALGYNAAGISEWMIYHFPLYNKFRAVESILVVAEFAMPLLAILALCTIMETGREAWKKWKKPICAAFAVPACISLLALLLPSSFGEIVTARDQYYQDNMLRQIEYYYAAQGATSQQIDTMLYEVSLSNPQVRQTVEALRAGIVRGDAARSLLFLALAFGVLLSFGCGKINKGSALCAIGLLVLIDLYGVDKRYVDSSSFGDPVDETYGIEADAIDNAIMADTVGHYRVLDAPEFDSPRRSYFHSMVGGYHAAKLNRYDELISYTLGSAHGRAFNPLALATAGDSLALKIANMLNARYIITGIPSMPLVRNVGAFGNAWLVDSAICVAGARAEMEGLIDADVSHIAVVDERFRTLLPEYLSSATADTIYMTYYSPNTVKYHAEVASASVAVFSEVFFPWGWKAEIDGDDAEIFRADYVLRAMTIPAGSHEIVMTFAPASLRSCSTAAYICICCIYVLLLLGLYMQIRRWRRC